MIIFSTVCNSETSFFFSLALLPLRHTYLYLSLDWPAIANKRIKRGEFFKLIARAVHLRKPVKDSGAQNNFWLTAIAGTYMDLIIFNRSIHHCKSIYNRK